MRGIDIFCASQAATAIRAYTMDEASSSSTTTTIHLGRAIDRHNPIIRDPKRITKSLPPCSSQLPITPKPLNTTNHHHHGIKSTTNKSFFKANDHHQSKKSSSSKPSDDENKKKKKKKKKGCAKPSDQSLIMRKSCVSRPGDFISPPASSRYLLGDRTTFLDVLSDHFDPVLALVPVGDTKSQADHVKPEESSASKPLSSSSSSSSSPDQVVVLRVSLHCKGCEGKVRKHISRMKGVTSFNIDFAAKKVTVVGDVTPLGVLASVSKVKSAQLWTPAMSSSAPIGGASTYADGKKLQKGGGGGA